MDKKSQILMSVLGVFALVIVTVGVSYAFFNYSRTGTTTNTIQSGEIQFTYTEGTDAKLQNVFPVADAIGATDTTGAYTFSVNTQITGSATMAYDIYLVNNNASISDQSKVFADSQIKVNLLGAGNGAAPTVIGTASTGQLMSNVGAWTTDSVTGESQIRVLTNQPIATGETHNYTLRLWIDDQVDYSNTSLTNDGTDVNNDAQTSVGKYNGYAYSLKVKVKASATNTYTGSQS